MNAERHVRIFKNGRSRAVRIPKEFDIFGDEAVLERRGEELILRAKPRRTPRNLVEYLRSLPPLGPDDGFPEIDDPPPEPVDF